MGFSAQVACSLKTALFTRVSHHVSELAASSEIEDWLQTRAGGADLSFSPSQGCATAMSRDYHFGECLTSVHCLHPGLGSDRPEAEYLRGEISCLEPTRLDTCTAAEHSFHASRDTGSASSILVLYPGLSIVFCTRVSSHEHEFTQWPPLVIYWPDATAHGFGGFTLQVI